MCRRLRRLEEEYEIHAVRQAHTRECSECLENPWELGDLYIIKKYTSKPTGPYVYEKICIACADEWLVCKEAEEEDY